MLAHKAVLFEFGLQILFTIALRASLPPNVVPPVPTISLPEQLNLTSPVNLSLFSPSHKCVSPLSLFSPTRTTISLINKITQHSPCYEALYFLREN